MREQELREQVAQDILSLKEFDGQPLSSLLAILWINKCADIALNGRK